MNKKLDNRALAILGLMTALLLIFSFTPIGERDMVLPVCSGDMLFNVFDEYMGFLK